MLHVQKVDAAQHEVHEWGAEIARGRWDWHRLGRALELCREAIRENANYQRAWTLLGNIYHLIGRRDLAEEALRRSYDLAGPGPNRPGNFHKQVQGRVESGEPFDVLLTRQDPPAWFLEKYAELLVTAPVLAEQVTNRDRPKVFIVHGHDLATLDQVELTLHRMGVEPRVLTRLVFPGRTIIEALETELSQADAVVCLLTEDDEGRQRGATALRPRPRQNVLVESGYAVINKRHRSVLVAIGDIEIPSDFDGILRVQHPSWAADAALALGRHLHAMGLAVDPSSGVPAGNPRSGLSPAPAGAPRPAPSPTCRIVKPAVGDRVKPSFAVEMEFTGLTDSHRVWLATSVSGRLWPKVSTSSPVRPRWTVATREAGRPPGGNFDLVVFLSTAEADDVITKWIAHGRLTNEWPGLEWYELFGVKQLAQVSVTLI
jgi:predicted nucleotide-binding protein